MAAHQAPPSMGFSRQEHWSGLPFPSPVHESEKCKSSRSAVSDSPRPHRRQPTRLHRPLDFPGKSTGVGCHCLLWDTAREFQKTIYFCFIDSVKAIDCVDHKKLWKIFKDMGIPDHLTCLMRNLNAGQEATVRTRHGSKLGKEYVKAAYCHPAYLNDMQNTSCTMLGWMKHKLESRFLGEISATSDMQVTPL